MIFNHTVWQTLITADCTLCTKWTTSITADDTRSQTFSFQQILFVERMTNWIHNHMVLGKRTCFHVSRLCIKRFCCGANPLPRFGSKELDLAVKQTHTDYTNLSTLPKTPHIYSKMCNIHLSTAGDLSHLKFYSDSTLLKAIWSHLHTTQPLSAVIWRDSSPKYHHIYLHSYPVWKPVWLSFFCGTQKKLF